MHLVTRSTLSKRIIPFLALAALPFAEPSGAAAAEPSPVAATPAPVLLATTTSTQDTGLLDVLVPAFEKKTGSTVKTIAVGSGQAMMLGKKGEADVLLVHSPQAEKQFMAAGLGTARLLVMHNDFVIVGPPSDPAKIEQAKSAADAFGRIAAAGSMFISRGDNSGTHAREKSLWKKAGIEPEGKAWYQQSGQGMGQTLAIVSEKQGYTLTDRGTWLALQKRLSLRLLEEGDPALLNVYHVIPVSPAGHARVNVAGGKAFADYLVSKEAQEIIGGFGKEKYGAPLFVPDAGKNEADLGR